MKRAMWIVWPSFLVAGLLEVLVFAAVDPSDLAHLQEQGWSHTGFYTVAFFAFWAAVAAASTLSLWLAGVFGPAADEAAARPSGALTAPPAGAAHPA